MVVPFLCNAWPNKVAQASSLACGRVLQARRGTSLSDWQARGMRYLRRLVASSVAIALAASAFGQKKPEAIPRDTGSDLLWKKLETRVEEIAARLDGVMGVAVLDLTDGRVLLRNADRVFAAASSIKLAILLELYRQDQEARAGAKGKARLDDIYSFDPKDLVEDSRIMAGVTPGVTRVVNGSLHQLVIADVFSDADTRTKD